MTVSKSAYGKTVHNTAVLSGDNIKDTEGKDKGVEIGDGKTKPEVTRLRTSPLPMLAIR